MNILERAIEFFVGLIILGVIIYVGINFFIEFAKAAFGLSPLTGIGFVISVGVAAYKGVLTLETMLVIFVGTVISYAAGTLIPQFLNNMFAGHFVAGIVYLFVILYLWAEAREIKGTGS